MGFFDKLKNGLGKTRNSFGDKINSVFSSFRKVDEELLEELEEILIMSDIGVDTSVEIIGRLRNRIKKEKIESEEDVKNALREEMKKILVAEDTESNYLLLSIILRKEYEVHRAHDGQEAIEKFEGCRPDMILMDIKMPVMDGLEATRRIRLKGGTLPIIALTANAYDSDRDKAFEAGCDDYMAKPIMAPALREMIKKYFGE